MERFTRTCVIRSVYALILSVSLQALGQDLGAQLHLGAQLLNSAENGDVNLVRSLLARGANIETLDGKSETPLLVAIEANKLDVAKLLLDHGANIEARSGWNSTPLILAVRIGLTNEVKLLLDRGANIEAIDGSVDYDWKDTPLLIAAKHGETDIVRLLLVHGANIDVVDQSYRRTPLAWAIEKKEPEIVKLLQDKTAENVLNDKLIGVAAEGDVNKMQLLLDAGANAEARNSVTSRPLIVAANAGKIEVLKLLLDHGANLEARDTDGNTPLVTAIANNKLDIAKLLLDRGANVDARDNNGGTALAKAVAQTNLDAVKLLMYRGANPEIKDSGGRAPLYYAALNGNLDIAKLLKQGGAGQGTEQQGPQGQFNASLKAFHSDPQSATLRRSLIQLVAALPQPPVIPEEARQLFDQATQQIKLATTPSALDLPITLLRRTVEIAPWWGNAYYNLSRALEMTSKFDEAEEQLNTYLQIKPDDSEARAHLAVIQTEKTAAHH